MIERKNESEKDENGNEIEATDTNDRFYRNTISFIYFFKSYLRKFDAHWLNAPFATINILESSRCLVIVYYIQEFLLPI